MPFAMSIRWSLCLVLSFCASQAAWAQPLSPKTIVWNQRSPQSDAYFGIVGEIARPGVYVSRSSQATLQELIRRAGGLTNHSSPAVRIIRNGRAGQSVFYQPDGQDVLAPNDLVVVDVLRSPQQPLTPPASPRVNRSVWIGLVGVSHRPEVVWVNPEQAQLPNVMVMLGQSAALAKSVRTILPPRLPQASDLFDLLPNGAVLVLDRSLLVTANLPEFPAALPLQEPAPNIATAQDLAPATVGAEPVSMPQKAVDAQPVPFVVDLPDQIPANPASLPAPGSRFAPSAPTAQPSTVTSQSPQPAAPPLFIETEPGSEAELVGIPAIAPPSKPTLGLWQMLGISGTVASLVGIALMSRQYLDRATTSAAPSVSGWSRPSPEIASTTESVEPIAQRLASPSSAVEEDLRAVLHRSQEIESEPAEFPANMSLTTRQFQPVYRVDEATESVDGPHFASLPKASGQMLFADASAEASIPAPHFRKRPSRGGAERTKAEAVPTTPLTGSAIERALSQLQEGLKS